MIPYCHSFALNMRGLFAVIMAACVLSILSIVHAVATRPLNSVSLKIKNRTGKSLDLYWVNNLNPNSANQVYQLQTQKPIRNGTGTNIYSYKDHSFLAEFHDPTEKARGVSVVFTKGGKDEEAHFDYDPVSMKLSVALKTAMEIVEDEVYDKASACRREHTISSSRSGDGGATAAELDAVMKCMASGVAVDVVRVTDFKESLKDARTKIAHRLRNYTCADPLSESSEPLRKYQWKHENKEYPVDVLLEQPAAKVWLAHSFVSDEECELLMAHGRPRLARATVAADDGTSVVSENRKAQQAAYMMDDHSKPGRKEDPLDSLYARIFAATNYHTGYTLQPPGQEGFTIIQYNPSDQYTPHCDGNCDGAAHVKYGRVATAVMYCHVPDAGGATTFTNNDIYVIPRKGSVTFFSYKDMETGLMDDGDTEHSGCPVLAGEKWITTVWMREGVSSAPGENWETHDPDGTIIGGTDREEEEEETSAGASSSTDGSEL